MVLKFVGWLHLKALEIAAWLFGWILKGIGKWVLVVLALLGEEFRRYAGLLLSGAIIVGFGKLFLGLPEMPGKRWVIMADLLFLAVWTLAVRRSVKHTMRNSLLRVKNRQAIQGMAADIAQIWGRVSEGLAKRAKGTPLEGAWSANRSAREEERTAAERAAAKAEEERTAAEEQARRDRISEAERERHLEKLGAEHNPFE